MIDLSSDDEAPKPPSPPIAGPLATPGPPAPASRDFVDPRATRAAIYDSTLKAVSTFKPIANQKYALALSGVDWADPPDLSRKDIKRAILEGRTLSRRLRGTWTLSDAGTGAPVATKKTTVAEVPYYTDDGTFVINGSRWSLASQSRLKAGVYTRRKENGELDSHVNVLPGSGISHRLGYDPESKIFTARFSGTTVPLASVMKALGATDTQLREAWGPVAAANLAKVDAASIAKLASKISRDASPDASPSQRVAKVIRSFPLDPEVTQRTLGKPYDRVDSDVYLDASRKLMALAKEEVDPDDRDHLAFMTIQGPEDLLSERVSKDLGLIRKALWKSTLKGNLSGMPPGVFTGPMMAAIQSSGLGQSLEEINPLGALEQRGRLSRMGTGGLPSIDSIPESSRAVQPSYLAFVDPIVTPENTRAGVDSRVATGVRKGADGRMYSRFLDARTGAEKLLSSADVADATVAFPGWRRSMDPFVPAMRGGRTVFVPRHRIDYELPAMEHAFGPISNLVPMKSAIKQQRLAMGARMTTQALPLHGAEAPHVRTGVPGEGDLSYEELYGPHAGAVRADQPGTVMEVTPDGIRVREGSGRERTYELEPFTPSNRKTYFSHSPAVKSLQRIAPGDLLARSNYTDDKGAIALGRNVRVAMLPGFGRHSVTGDTHVLAYVDGQPVFGPIADLPEAPERLGTLVLDRDRLVGQVRPVTGFVKHDATRISTVKTSSGRIIRTTEDHSFVVLGDDGELREAKTTELVPGKSWIPRLGAVELPVVAAAVTIPAAGKSAAFDVSLDFDFGFICGLYAAEGDKNGNQARFACTDPVLRAYLVGTLGRVFPGLPVYTRSTTIVAITSVSVAAWLKEQCGPRSQLKKVPDVTFGAPNEFRRGFLGGFWVGDGRVSHKNDTPVDTDTLVTSRRLRDGLGLLCASLGISTTHSTYPCPACSEGWIYRLGLATRDTWKLPNLPHSEKHARLQRLAAAFKDTAMASPLPLFAAAVPVYKRGRKGLDLNAGARNLLHRKKGRTTRRDVSAFIPADDASPASRRMRLMADSPVEWDRIVSVETREQEAETVYDFATPPDETFVCIDTLVIHNSNYEDAFLISESLAKKFTSQHAYQHDVDDEDGKIRGRSAFVSAFPSKYPKAIIDNFNDDGLIRPGTVVKTGDPLVLSVRKKEPSRDRVYRGHSPTFTDAAETWDHDHDGVVTDVVRTKDGVKVIVKTEAPTHTADKLCFDEETEVLTSRGWKPIAEVGLEDRVCCLEGERVAYRRPTAVHRYPTGDRMYRIKSQQVDLFVTARHRMYVKLRKRNAKFGLLPAESLFGKLAHYKKSGEWTGRSPKFVRFRERETRAGRGGVGVTIRGGEKVDTATFMALLGAYLSEGSSFHSRKGSGINIHQTTPGGRARFERELLPKLEAAGFHCYICPDRYRIYCRSLYEYFKRFGKSKRKYIPNRFFGYSKPHLEILFDWLMWGDGHTKSLPIDYTTTSPRLADDVQRLCLHIGKAANIKELPAPPHPMPIKGRYYMMQDRYDVRIINTKLTPAVNHAHVKKQKAQEEYFVDSYDKPVYCVTVPQHVLYVRRNGKPVWSGNSGRMGNKGVIGSIIPDDEMPVAEDGKPVELLYSPYGTISRTNPAAIIEMWLGKIAEKTGKPYKIKDFDRIDDLTAFAQDELRKHGLKATETVTDPRTGRKIPGVTVGNMFTMKLHHVAESKAQARGTGGYTADGMPARGGYGGSKRLALMSTNALLSHGATDVLKDALHVRGAANPDYWLQFMSGHAAQGMQVPFVHRKFFNQLKAAGLNVTRDGARLNIMALTPKDIDELAGERTIRNAETVNWKDGQKPIAGGLFDESIFGGRGAESRWGAIDLVEPMPSPAMEEPIRRVLKLTEGQFRDVLAGRRELDNMTGPGAIRAALDRIDVPKAMAQARADIAAGRKTTRDEAIRRLGFLVGADKNGVHPRDWVWNRAPVLPPAFRPVSIMQATGRPMVNDANVLYHELFAANQNLGDMKSRVSDVGDERLAVYDALKAVAGLGDPIQPRSRERGIRGAMAEVVGDSPKFGTVQQKLLASTVDLVGRGVIVPDHNLDLDSVGIPEAHAWEVYKPFVVRRLVRNGLPRSRAALEVTDRTPTARKALLAELGERPVKLDRAPVLHRYGVMAFWPKLRQGDAIALNPLVTSGYGADYNGDSCVTDLLPLLVDGKPFLGTFEEFIREWVDPEYTEATCIERYGIQTTIFEFCRTRDVSVLGIDEKNRPAWQRASHISIHTSHGPDCYRVRSETGLDAVFTAHHNFWQLNDYCELEAVKTDRVSAGSLIPVAGRVDVGDVSATGTDSAGFPFDLDFDAGLWFGHYAAEGCITGRNDTISHASTLPETLDYIEAVGNRLAGRNGWREGNGHSVRWTGKVWVETMRAWGRGSENIRLPAWVLTAPAAFRKGLLAGYLIGDGNVQPRLCRTESTSRRLLLGMKLIAASLGVPSTVREGKPARGRYLPTWKWSLSCESLRQLEIPWPDFPRSGEFQIAARRNKRRNGYEIRDRVPFPRWLPALCRRLGLCSRLRAVCRPKAARLVKSAVLPGGAIDLRQLARSAEAGSGTRRLAEQLIERYGLRRAKSRRLRNWIALVDAKDLTWDVLESVEKVDRPDVTYDFSVPGREAFAVDGLYMTHNTMNFHVPASAPAVREAVDKLLPSKNLFSTSDFRVHQLPLREYAAGLYHATRPSGAKKQPVYFRSEADAIAAFHRGEIGADQPVRIADA